MSQVTDHPSQDDPKQSETKQLQSDITCPFCGSVEVELFSLFGSQLLTTEYYCNDCRTVFESVKR